MSLLGCTGPHEARLPMGMDLVGRPFGEPLLLRVAAALEAAGACREPPPVFAWFAFLYINVHCHSQRGSYPSVSVPYTSKPQHIR